MKKILKGLRIVIVSVLAIVILLCVGFYAVTWRRCRTISSIKSIPEGGYYEVEYRSDYKFDDFLKEGASSDDELVDFVRKKLFMNAPTEVDPKNQFSCSTMSIKSTNGDYLFGRDFDWLSPTTPILVHTKPKNGYESYSMTNIKYITDEYTLDDCIGKILTLSLPYMPLDGINEKGVSMSVMTVNEFAADQHTGKKGINTNTAIRLVLDKAADVDEAISLLKKYDMHASGIYKENYHFLIADSKGNSAIVEYVNNQMKVIKKDGDFQVCTNFTVSNFEGVEIDDKICDRYSKYNKKLSETNGVLSENDAFDFLKQMSSKKQYLRGHGWSIQYNNTKKNMILSTFDHFKKNWTYQFGDEIGDRDKTLFTDYIALAILPILLLILGVSRKIKNIECKKGLFILKSKRATKNTESWSVAKKCFGNVCIGVGFITLLVTEVFLYIIRSVNMNLFIGLFIGIIVAQVVSYMLPFLMTERKLKKIEKKK